MHLHRNMYVEFYTNFWYTLPVLLKFLCNLLPNKTNNLQLQQPLLIVTLPPFLM